MKENISTTCKVVVLCVVIISLYGCVNYYTRYFKLVDRSTDNNPTNESYSFMGLEGVNCNRFFVDPEVWALLHTTGTHEFIDDPESYHHYEISIDIYDKSAIDTFGIKDMISECFSIKKVFIYLSNSEIGTLKLEKRFGILTFPESPPFGLGFYFGNHYIPPDIDSIRRSGSE